MKLSAHRPLFLHFFRALSTLNKKLEGHLKKQGNEIQHPDRQNFYKTKKNQRKNLYFFFCSVKKKQCLSYSKKIFFGVGPETMRHVKIQIFIHFLEI